MAPSAASAKKGQSACLLLRSFLLRLSGYGGQVGWHANRNAAKSISSSRWSELRCQRRSGPAGCGNQD